MPPYENADDEMIGLFGSYVLDDDDMEEPSNGRDGSNAIPIPLIGVHVDAEAVDFVAEVTISQCYRNDSPAKTVDAVYRFPVDHAASVFGFFAHYDDGRVVRGVIKEKEGARKEYLRAKAEGKQANLLETHRGQRDILSLRVGNLGPGHCVKIVISYVTMLKAQGDAMAFVLPTYIAPRYTPSSMANSNANDDNNGGDYHLANGKAGFPPDTALPISSVKLYGLNIHGKFVCSSNIESIDCPTHSEGSGFTFQIQGKTGTVAFADDIAMDRDLVLLVTEEVPHQPRACVEVAEDGTLAGLVTLFPKIEFQDEAREFVFLVDRSVSMSCSNGGKRQIQQAGESLTLFLRALPPSCYFNIVGFGSSFSPLFDSPRKYNDQSLEEATNYALSMMADMGGTELAAPLEHVLSGASTSNTWMQSMAGSKNLGGGAAERQVFVLTDGQVSNINQVFDIIHKHCSCAAGNGNNNRVFALGVGSGASRHLVEGMARAGRGTARFVDGGDADSLRAKVLEQLKQALQPALNNVSIEWEFPPESCVPVISDASRPTTPPAVKTLLGYRSPSASKTPELSRPDLRIFPSVPPPVFNSEKFVSFALFDAKQMPKSVTVKCESPDGLLEVSIPVCDENVFQGSIAHKMAARVAISEFEDGKNSFGGPFTGTVSKKEALDLALEHGLVSEQTSFIAVLEDPVVESGVESVEQVIPQYDPFREAVVHRPAARTGYYPSSNFSGPGSGFDLRSPGSSMQCNIADMLKGSAELESLADKSDQLNEQAIVYKKSVALRKKTSLAGRLSYSFSPTIATGFRGIRDWVSKYLNPDATLVDDLGEEMKAYHDKKQKVWVFPGEDPGEKVKPNVAPPLATLGTSQAPPAPTDTALPPAVAAMMAPPRRAIPGTGSLLELCLLQRADGSFLLDERLARALGLSLARLRHMAAAESAAPPPASCCGVNSEDDSSAAVVAATLIAVAALRSRFANRRPVWELQEDKALKFLDSMRKSDPNIDDANTLKIDIERFERLLSQ